MLKHLNKKIVFIFFMVITFCLFSTKPSYSEFACHQDYWENIVEPQSYFVKVPTTIGNKVGGIVGGVAGILGGVVTGVVRAPFTKGKSLGRDSLYGAAIVGCPLSEATGAVIGSPFYVLEKSLWDFPKWLFSSKDSTEEIEEEQEYNNGINTDA